MPKIGDRIKELRAGLSQEEFGKKFGVTSVTISAIEKGKQNPGWDLAEAICDEYGVSLDWLRGKTEIKSTATQSTVQEDMGKYVTKDKYIEILEEVNELRKEKLKESLIRQTALEK